MPIIWILGHKPQQLPYSGFPQSRFQTTLMMISASLSKQYSAILNSLAKVRAFLQTKASTIAREVGNKTHSNREPMALPAKSRITTPRPATPRRTI